MERETKEPGIYVEAKPVGGTKGSASEGGVFYHLYLIYRRDNGETEVIRGGPDSHLRLAVETGKRLPDSKDAYDKDKPVRHRPSVKLQMSPEQQEDAWRKMRSHADRIGKARLTYDPLIPGVGGAERTSNSVIRASLKAVGYPSEKALPLGIKPSDVPGYESALGRDLARAERLNPLKEGAQRRKAAREFDRNWPIGNSLPAEKPLSRDEEKSNGHDAASGGNRGAPSTDGGVFARDSLIDDLTRLDDPLDDLRLKKPKDLTEDEVRQVMERRQATIDDAERAELFGIEEAHFDHRYSGVPTQRDATGRTVEPEARNPVNRAPVPARAADGRTVAEALSTVASKVADVAASKGGREAIKALQRGLNILNTETPAEVIPAKIASGKAASGRGGAGKSASLLLPPGQATKVASVFDGPKQGTKLGRAGDSGAVAGLPMYRELLNDGDAGPKTRAALRRATARFGSAGIAEGLALSQFDRFARDRAAGQAGDLKGAAAGAFGPLFPAPSKAAKARPEGYGVQMAVNDLGRGHFGPSFTALKEDGDIGPKTEAAFDQVMRATGPDRLAGALGRGLGFFGAAEEMDGLG